MMRRNRYHAFVFLAASACGDNKQALADAAAAIDTAPPIDTMIDVPIPPDAPIDAFTCSFMPGTTIDTKTTPIDFSLPIQLTLHAAPSTDGKLAFSVVITFMSDPTHGIFMFWHDTLGVFAATGANTAGLFTKPPTPGAYPMDVDATIGAGVDFVNGITDNGDGTVSIKPTQVYQLNNNPTALFNLTTWTGAAVADGTTTNISASYTGAMMQGFDVGADGTLTMNACSLMITKLEWIKLAVKWPPTLPPVSSAAPDKPFQIDWSQTNHVPHVIIPD